MRKKLSVIIAIVILIAGTAVLLYPTVSDYVNSRKHRQEIYSYRGEVQHLDGNEYDELIRSAVEYNERLAEKHSFSLTLSGDEEAVYDQLLRVPGTEAMGYVEIPAISISLPIYHGTSDAVLQSGIGHIEGSSLPVGGKSVHSVLSGHTGLPSSKLFTNIDKLVEGDKFYLHILNEVYAYEVDNIQTILPEELSSLAIEEGKDYCTLVTCTPYGVNTHRLLVRGHRIEYTAEEHENNDKNNGYIAESSRDGDEKYILIAASCIIFGIVLFLTIVLLILRKRRKEAGSSTENNDAESKGDTL